MVSCEIGSGLSAARRKLIVKRRGLLNARSARSRSTALPLAGFASRLESRRAASGLGRAWRYEFVHVGLDGEVFRRIDADATARTIADPRICNGRPTHKSTTAEIAEVRMGGAERPRHGFVTSHKRARYRFIRVSILTIERFTRLPTGADGRLRTTAQAYLEQRRRMQ